MAFEEEVQKEIQRVSARKAAVLSVLSDYRRKRLVFKDSDLQSRAKLREIKVHSIKNLEALLSKAVISFEQNGIQVHKAKTAIEAVSIIDRLSKGAKIIAKSKSGTCSEIGLNSSLLSGRLVETDTGDFIMGLIGKKGEHPVLPALHVTPAEISKAIKRKLNVTVNPEPDAIAHFIASRLRTKILQAKVGITGANAITSDGNIVILENEGNVSLVSRLPEKHIVVAGIEKVVPTLEDAMHVVKCSAKWGTGQRFPSYVNIISGPSQTADIEDMNVVGSQGAMEVHLILLDNGRRELARDYPEILYCISCGACDNACSAYQNLLSFFGGKYPGPKGLIYSAIAGGDERLYLCMLCKGCEQECPCGIALPDAIRKIRGIAKKEQDREMLRNMRTHNNPFGNVEKGTIPDKLYCC